MVKKIVSLNIYYDDEKKVFNGEMKYRCDTKETALDVVQSFIDRKRKKGEKQDA